MTGVIKAVVAFGLAGLWLAGCLGLGPKPDPSRYFTLSSLYPTGENVVKDPVEGQGVSLGIGPLKFPGYLDRQEIVIRSDQNRLEISQTDRWGEPLEENFARVLSQNLAALLRTDRIIAFPWSRDRKPNYQIEIEVLRFEANSAGDAVLLARWMVIDGGSGKVVSSKESRLTRPAKVKSTDAMTAALSETVGDLSREIADFVRAIEGGKKP